MSEATDSTQLPWRRILEQATVVVIDGSTIPDPDTGHPRAAITVQMPAFVAEHLARVLAGWSVIGQVVEESWSGEETDAAFTLDAAARVARGIDDQLHG
jgi:hypothetical protein